MLVNKLKYYSLTFKIVINFKLDNNIDIIVVKYIVKNIIVWFFNIKLVLWTNKLHTINIQS